MQSSTAAVLRAARPRFLSLTLACVLVGIGAAVQTRAPMSVAECLLVLTGALLAHASVNLLNEYGDFRSGLDFRTVRTPFSGGSGSLVARPEAAAATLAAGLAVLAASAAIGLYLVGQRGIGLLPIGLAGVLLVATYTPLVTRHPLLCLLAPGLGVGPLMVMGTAYALTGHYSWTAAAASLPPLFLGSELLLVNQLPDVEADRSVGRRNLPIMLGRKRSALVSAGLVAAAHLALVAGWACGALPRLVLLALAPLPAWIFLAQHIHRNAGDTATLIRYLGINVAMIHALLLLEAGALLVG